MTTIETPTTARAGRPKSITAPRGVRLCGYSMRNMREDYLDRLRLLAVYGRTSLEQQVLLALSKGLPVLETERRAKRTATKAVASRENEE